MATDGPDMEDVPVAGRDVTTNDYREKTRQTSWLVLEDYPMKVEIEPVPPFTLLKRLKQYGLARLIDADPESVGAEDMTGEDVDNLSRLMGDFVVERIVTPANAYWDEEPEDAEAEIFDLTELSTGDQMTLITGLIAGDTGELDGFQPGDGERVPDID